MLPDHDGSRATPYSGPTVILTADELAQVQSVLILHAKPWNKPLRARIAHALALQPDPAPNPEQTVLEV